MDSFLAFHISQDPCLLLIQQPYKWYGGAQAANGLIYCVPRSATSVLIVDPVSLTTDVTTLVVECHNKIPLSLQKHYKP
ncbi:hypothetical protein PTSG_12312 [Salpingoeca rosetta]|uniref:Uncharacterized protein n=1 Tax=Salpingoeca rosetta (strain ATCC 50818 / BSB-021) TaxID=946362 RepID=F2UAA7_SALR5|nr:uncharacterized protein PTSG_12312 [Salpingoeca rosetta]EGD73682.1 hypothetical protein PTSG_12312 [Salpingoeca rosetta]|eukprot:XP_004993963.1 hypothetical protein PTSG_12312 [Salpingoeca rosetta]